MRTKIRHYSFLSDDAKDSSVLEKVIKFLSGEKHEYDKNSFKDISGGEMGVPVLSVPGYDEPIPLTEELTRVLHDAARELLHGNEVAIVPSTSTLTTQEAADILGVSRPTFIRVLEAGDIAFYKVGKHRRVQLADVLEYQREHHEKAIAAFDSLAVDEDPMATLENPLITQ